MCVSYIVVCICAQTHAAYTHVCVFISMRPLRTSLCVRLSADETHSPSYCTPLKSKGNFESRNLTVAHHYQAHIVAERSKEVPLAQITTVHLLKPIKYSQTWKRICRVNRTGQHLTAVNVKYEAIHERVPTARCKKNNISKNQSMKYDKLTITTLNLKKKNLKKKPHYKKSLT